MGTLVTVTNPYNDDVVKIFFGCDRYLDAFSKFLILRGLDLSVEEAEAAPKRSDKEEREVQLMMSLFAQEMYYG